MKHRQIIFSQLFIPRRNASKLFEAVYQSLYSIPHFVISLVKRAASLVVRPSRNRVADASTAQVRPVILVTVAAVANNPIRFLLRSAWTSPIDFTLFHQRDKTYRVVALSRGQYEGHRLAVRLAADINLSREAASGVT